MSHFGDFKCHAHGFGNRLECDNFISKVNALQCVRVRMRTFIGRNGYWNIAYIFLALFGEGFFQD